MATVRLVNTPWLAIDGGPAVPLRTLQVPGYRIDPVSAPASGGSLIRAGQAVTLTEMAADVLPNSAGPLLAWAERFAAGDLAAVAGTAWLVDANFSARRSLDFDGAELTQLRLPTLSAADARGPVQLGLSWRMRALIDRPGDGRKITASGGRPKAMLSSNFRVTGLPFDGAQVSAVALPLLRRADTVGIAPWRPELRASPLHIGPLQLTLAGRSAEAGRAWVQKLVSDGRVDEAEGFDFGVDLLDAALKTVLARIDLAGCCLLASDEPPIDTASDTPPTLALRLSVRQVKLDFKRKT